jgi:methyl-accepting chemotaxis protein
MLNLRIRSILIILGAVVATMFCLSLAVQQFGASKMAINSGRYNDIVRAKDLVADVLPPPAYLIEAYLETRLAADEPGKLKVHQARLADLKQQYLDRRNFWAEKAGWGEQINSHGALYDLIAKGSHAEASRFWNAVDQHLLPALASGNALAASAARSEISAAYLAHREKVDQIVKGAVQLQADLEGAARFEALIFIIVEFVIIAIALAITAGGFYLVFQRVIRPVSVVTGVMKKLAAGDLHTSTRGADRKDEIGDMVRAVEVFRANLLETERMRAEQSETAARAEAKRRESLREMALSVEAEASSAVTRVGQQAGEMARLAEHMTGSLSSVTSQCHGVASAAQEALASATSVTAATQEFSVSIQEVSQQLTRARSVTSATVATSERTRAAVANLAQAVDKIGDVANIISEIADQTNLLALNATIEAARAGEAGRGFAVVASEVKSLSSQTARSTEEIRKHVAGIQMVMRETTDVVAEIGRQIASVDEGSTVIAAAMEEQSATIDQIARHVEATARASSYVSDSVAIVLDEAAKTGEGARSLATTVGDVDDSIARLREAIIRVVRTSSPDVERRTDTRFDVHAPGELIEKRQMVTVENLSRGGALLSQEADVSSGETGRLKIADQQVSFKVLRTDKAGAHLQFDSTAVPNAERAIGRLAADSTRKKAG